jgi:hypothetical protein
LNDDFDNIGDIGGSHGATLPPLDLPLRRPYPMDGGHELGSDEAEPSDPDRFLEEVLEPQALQTYRDLLLDPDPKVRRQAASDVMEMRGKKGKVAPNLGGITFNLAPERAQKLIEGLAKVFQKPQEYIDV